MVIVELIPCFENAPNIWDRRLQRLPLVIIPSSVQLKISSTQFRIYIPMAHNTFFRFHRGGDREIAIFGKLTH